MRSFIKKSLIFILIPLIFLIIVIFIYQNRVVDLKIENNIEIIISGDSHTQSGIIDNLIPNSLNISQSSEHFFYTYNVLKFLFRNNPNIKTVILGTSFHSFGEFYDEWVFEQSKIMYPKYFPILDKESRNFIYSKNFFGFIDSCPFLLKEILVSILNVSNYQDYGFLGKNYISYKKNLNDSIIDRDIKRHFMKNGDVEQDFSKLQILYLNKIVELCSINDIKLILVNTPITTKYLDKIPEKFITNYYRNIKHLGSKVVFWDFHLSNFGDDCFGDGHHLNTFGAEKLSRLIDLKLDNTD